MGTPGFEIPPLLKTRFQNYWLNGSYDEMFEAEGMPRARVHRYSIHAGR
jgi:hypothetical protein